MVDSGYKNYQGFPLGNTPMVDQQGNLTLPWARFMISLWQRAGSYGTLQQIFYLQQVGSQIRIINSANGEDYGSFGTVSSVGLQADSGVFFFTNTPVTSTGTIVLNASGISGGVPYFDTGSHIASSPMLESGKLVIGGGTGAAPSTPVPFGSLNTVLHGNSSGAPTWGQVNLSTDVSATLPVVNGGTGTGIGYTVASLPTGVATGTRSWVTNALNSTYLVGASVTAAITGGFVIPVFYNGSAWVAG
jgi:hypothetical protein